MVETEINDQGFNDWLSQFLLEQAHAQDQADRNMAILDSI